MSSWRSEVLSVSRQLSRWASKILSVWSAAKSYPWRNVDTCECQTNRNVLFVLNILRKATWNGTGSCIKWATSPVSAACSALWLIPRQGSTLWASRFRDHNTHCMSSLVLVQSCSASVASRENARTWLEGLAAAKRNLHHFAASISTPHVQQDPFPNQSPCNDEVLTGLTEQKIIAEKYRQQLTDKRDEALQAGAPDVVSWCPGGQYIYPVTVFYCHPHCLLWWLLSSCCALWHQGIHTGLCLLWEEEVLPAQEDGSLAPITNLAFSLSPVPQRGRCRVRHGSYGHSSNGKKMTPCTGILHIPSVPCWPTWWSTRRYHLM